MVTFLVVRVHLSIHLPTLKHGPHRHQLEDVVCPAEDLRGGGRTEAGEQGMLGSDRGELGVRGSYRLGKAIDGEPE